MMLGEEDPREFREFYGRLLDEWQPVGPSEEFEVERIAICELKSQRLWRYENAEIRASSDSVGKQAEDRFYEPLSHSTRRSTLISLLQTAEKEAEANGQISEELLGKIYARQPVLRYMWKWLEEKAEKTAQKKRNDIAVTIAERRQIPLSEAKSLLMRDGKSVPERQQFVVAETVRQAREEVYSDWWRSSLWEIRNDYERCLIPDDSVVNEIIRYGNAIEKQRERALDRLERLQRRRKGESVLPPVRVRLAQ